MWSGMPNKKEDLSKKYLAISVEIVKNLSRAFRKQLGNRTLPQFQTDRTVGNEETLSQLRHSMAGNNDIVHPSCRRCLRVRLYKLDKTNKQQVSSRPIEGR